MSTRESLVPHLKTQYQCHLSPAGSESTMWPPGENPALREYAPDP
jgi:hypothetical protein